MSRLEGKKIVDSVNGGFGIYPKFPTPQYVLFLLNYYEIYNDTEALIMVKSTLEKMYKGGSFDHIGYGMFRYSTDEQWLVPHFEKMLNDNALMSLAYTRTYEITNNNLYKEIAQKIYEFLIRDMQSEEGGFYYSLNADSQGVEGKYYIFDYDEIIELLGEEWGGLFNKYYDITKEGNFSNHNIPNLIHTNINDINTKDAAMLDSIKQMLFTYREKRVNPHRDNKIKTSCNGLMIGSLANAGVIYENEFYIKKSIQAAEFLISNSIDDDGNLLSTHIEGESFNKGNLEDYVFFMYGLISLYRATKIEKYVVLSKKLADKMLVLFDHSNGSMPIGKCLVLINLMKLYTTTDEDHYLERAIDILNTFIFFNSYKK